MTSSGIEADKGTFLKLSFYKTNGEMTQSVNLTWKCKGYPVIPGYRLLLIGSAKSFMSSFTNQSVCMSVSELLPVFGLEKHERIIFTWNALNAP